ncbi:V-type ATPase subunit [Sedimentibacter sp.]|uniref:V-type ATPase subunit n=1 Tax=Sedimentibacter sp. TaxID=1960295 RepID=UPI0028AEBE0D|nr:V-type ATPase subunit [Sedimentibacter sp.]
MNPNMAYYALETKIATKKGHILNNKDWKKYIESDSVEKLAELLKNNPEIGKVFKDINNTESERVNLETALSSLRKFEIENLLHYLSGDYKEFLKTFLIEEDIKDLSLVLRKLSRGESSEGIKERFIHSKMFTCLNFEEILTAKNIEQLIKKLKGSIFYNGIKNISNNDVLNREFHFEMKLYLVLYKSLLERAEKLDRNDSKTAKDIIGLRIDLLNIQWIYRAIKYYNISSQEIYFYSLEGGNILDNDKIKNLCYSKSFDEFKLLVKDYFKYDLFKDLQDTDIDINVVVDAYMFNYIKNKNYKNIGLIISFIYLLDSVINDLTSITEGVQYQVPKEKLKGYLAYKI